MRGADAVKLNKARLQVDLLDSDSESFLSGQDRERAG